MPLTSGTPLKLTLLRSWLTPAGWRARWERLLGGAKSMYTISRCRKLIKPWSMAAFKADALKLYIEVCRRQAAGDRTALRQVISGVQGPLEHAWCFSRAVGILVSCLKRSVQSFLNPQPPPEGG